jgi:hypothetical protein
MPSETPPQEIITNRLLKEKLHWSLANRLTTSGWSSPGTTPTKLCKIDHRGITSAEEILLLITDTIKQFLDSANSCMLYRMRMKIDTKEHIIFLAFQPVTLPLSE